MWPSHLAAYRLISSRQSEFRTYVRSAPESGRRRLRQPCRTSLLHRSPRRIVPTCQAPTRLLFAQGWDSVSIPRPVLGRQLMVELAPFLTNLGLSQYIGTFADNDIDGPALLELEEAHLKELGLSLGHRVRLMKAISELRLANSHAPASIASNLPMGTVAVAPDEVRRTASQSSADGERRQLTVMFAD